MERTIGLGANDVDRLSTTVIDLGLHVPNAGRNPITNGENNGSGRLRHDITERG